jgi:hypothetical protein
MNRSFIPNSTNYRVTPVYYLNVPEVEVYIPHYERKIDTKIRTIDKNGNDKYVEPGTQEADEAFNNAANRTFNNVKNITNLDQVDR